MFVLGLLLFGSSMLALGALLVLWAVFGWGVWIGEDPLPPSLARAARSPAAKAGYLPTESHRHTDAHGQLVFVGPLAKCPRCDMASVPPYAAGPEAVALSDASLEAMSSAFEQNARPSRH